MMQKQTKNKVFKIYVKFLFLCYQLERFDVKRFPRRENVIYLGLPYVPILARLLRFLRLCLAHSGRNPARNRRQTQCADPLFSCFFQRQKSRNPKQIQGEDFFLENTSFMGQKLRKARIIQSKDFF